MQPAKAVSLRPESTVPKILDARRVAEEAESAVLALSLTKSKEFESLYSYLIVDEPSIHLLPLHFLPFELGELVGDTALHDLGVAAKIEYTRNRWLDEMVDASESSPDSLTVHRLNAALIVLTNNRYARALNPLAGASFFATLAELHARHGLSLVLDGRKAKRLESPLSLKGYVEHARARHGPMRAPLDAVLLLAGAPAKEIRRARSSWHNWELGVQFYDDALDIEEDFRQRNLSWVVSRTLEVFRERLDRGNPHRLPDPDVFYEIALTEDVVCQALTYAERFFTASARQAEQPFPTWAAFQRQCIRRTVLLREDHERILAATTEN